MELDKEFRSLMPRLTSDELAKLNQSIRSDGCRDALIVWNNILVDGYNRYEICTKHNIEFKTIQKEFADRETVIGWIIDNQLGRRNLTLEQKNYLIGKKYKREKQSRGGDRKSKGNFYPLKSTAEKIAEEQKITQRTIKNAEKFADAIDVITPNIGEEAKQSILSREIPATATEVKNLAQKPADIQKAVIGKITSGKAKNLKNATKLVAKELQQKERESLANEGAAIKVIDKVKLYCGDFRTEMAKIDDNSLDLIFTDPPYGKEYLPLWEALSKKASEKLKPGGFLIAYSGQMHLPEVIKSLKAHMEYYWTIALIHSGTKQLINGRNFFCAWKPILIFYKPPLAVPEAKIEDTINGSGREKEFHDWQQAEEEIQSLIEVFSKPNDVICDVFAGSGTVIVKAVKMNRQAIGIDEKLENINIIKTRVGL